MEVPKVHGKTDIALMEIVKVHNSKRIFWPLMPWSTYAGAFLKPCSSTLAISSKWISYIIATVKAS